MTLKIVRQTLFRMTFAVGRETAAVGFCRRGERSGLALNRTRKVEVYSQGEEGGSVDGKLIGNIKGKGKVWLSQPNRILAEGRPG